MASPRQQKFEGQWDQVKGKLKKVWGNLTDDDLLKAEGDYDRTVGIIKQRTGETREEVERKIRECGCK